jgi:hypothetical protein
MSLIEGRLLVIAGLRLKAISYTTSPDFVYSQSYLGLLSAQGVILGICTCVATQLPLAFRTARDVIRKCKCALISFLLSYDHVMTLANQREDVPQDVGTGNYLPTRLVRLAVHASASANTGLVTTSSKAYLADKIRTDDMEDNAMSTFEELGEVNSKNSESQLNDKCRS